MVEVKIEGKRSDLDEESWNTSPTIAAGGLSSYAVHVADIKITVSPTSVPGLSSLTVELTSNGGGHSPTDWWWDAETYFKKAKLTITDVGEFEHGDTTAITLDLTSASTFSGTLISSNKAETTKVTVASGDDYSKSMDVDFSGGTLTLRVCHKISVATKRVPCYLCIYGRGVNKGTVRGT